MKQTPQARVRVYDDYVDIKDDDEQPPEMSEEARESNVERIRKIMHASDGESESESEEEEETKDGDVPKE